MRPIQQTLFTDIENKVLGNCFAAALASLFELSLLEVPPFHKMKQGHDERMAKFASAHQYEYNGIIYGNPDLEPGVDGIFIVSCPCLDYPPYHHCVLWQDGVIIHDPSTRAKQVRLGPFDHFFDIRRIS